MELKLPETAMAVIASMIVGLDVDEGLRSKAAEELGELLAALGDDIGSEGVLIQQMIGAVKSNSRDDIDKVSKVAGMLYGKAAKSDNKPMTETVGMLASQAYDDFIAGMEMPEDKADKLLESIMKIVKFVPLAFKSNMLVGYTMKYSCIFAIAINENLTRAQAMDRYSEFDKKQIIEAVKGQWKCDGVLRERLVNMYINRIDDETDEIYMEEVE